MLPENYFFLVKNARQFYKVVDFSYSIQTTVLSDNSLFIQNYSAILTSYGHCVAC